MGATVHNEAPPETPPAQPDRSADVDEMVVETKKDWEDRQADSLDESHIEAAEQDLEGNPAKKPGRPMIMRKRLGIVKTAWRRR